MTWRNPQLAPAAQQWRLAQNALLQAQRPIRVRDEETSSQLPARPGQVDLTALELRANSALAECLRINRQADARGGR